MSTTDDTTAEPRPAAGTPPPGRGPVFLAGADRSGIGLLGELLEHHPSFALTRRTDYWTRVVGRYGDLRHRPNLDRLLDEIAADRRLRLLTPDRQRLDRDLAGDEASYVRLFAMLQEQRAARLDRARWGDKSLGNERHADQILGAYPEARMVQVLRDPRDRFASQKYHRGLGRGGLGAGAAMWRDSARRAVHNAIRYPERYLVVHYERLVRDPASVLHEVVTFLGEPASTAATTLAAAEADAAGPGPLHDRSVGRFRRDLEPSEVAFLELATRPWADRLGYPTGEKGQDRVRGLRFALAEVPRHGAGMLAWSLRTRLPARAKLRPR
ncbi:sulfotransferase [Egicoccus sp. AB-alg2]|uniref:sulfotransferase family protein n=1 Tax=Egicoccus sp. AB-alg2 TaxID=3242693 RepID=UPI00359D70DA